MTNWLISNIICTELSDSVVFQWCLVWWVAVEIPIFLTFALHFPRQTWEFVYGWEWNRFDPKHTCVIFSEACWMVVGSYQLVVSNTKAGIGASFHELRKVAHDYNLMEGLRFLWHTRLLMVEYMWNLIYIVSEKIISSHVMIASPHRLVSECVVTKITRMVCDSNHVYDMENNNSLWKTVYYRCVLCLCFRCRIGMFMDNLIDSKMLESKFIIWYIGCVFKIHLLIYPNIIRNIILNII